MKLIDFLVKVSKEGYRPKKIQFNDLIFEPVKLSDKVDGLPMVSDIVCQYTSTEMVNSVVDNEDDEPTYQTLMEWLLFDYWLNGTYEDLGALASEEVTILEE